MSMQRHCHPMSMVIYSKSVIYLPALCQRPNIKKAKGATINDLGGGGENREKNFGGHSP